MPPKKQGPRCPYCKERTKRAWGIDIYGENVRGTPLEKKLFWRCKTCEAHVGTHRNGSPLGNPANKEARAARMKAHAAFDKLWKNGKMERTEAYRRLARELGKEVEKTHIGWMYEEEANLVVEIVRTGRLLIP